VFGLGLSIKIVRGGVMGGCVGLLSYLGGCATSVWCLVVGCDLLIGMCVGVCVCMLIVCLVLSVSQCVVKGC